MRAFTDGKFKQATTANITITLLLAGGLLACGAARADDFAAANAEVDAALAADQDNAIRTLKAGEAAQQRRYDARLRELDPETRMRIEGRTDDADELRERGNRARHARQDIRRREMFDRRLADDAAGNRGATSTTNARNDVERLGREPETLDRLQRSGDQARARRGYPAREVSDLAEGRAPESRDLERRGEIARRNRGMGGAGVDAPRASADAAPRTTPRGRPGAKAVAKGVAGGLVAGWAVETATGVHVPDPIDAAQWTADSLQRPQDMPQRVGQLAEGAVDLTGQVATSLTRPDRMAVNLVNGAAGVVNTGAHMVTHPKEAVAAVGNTVVGVGNAAVGIGTGLGKGAVTVANGGVRAMTHPVQTANAVGKGVVKAANGTARAVNKFGCGVDRLFKPRKKC
jgi:hypothetical protein